RGAAALILTAPGLSVINDAIDEARRIFGRITTYTIYRIALTMDIMFVVVLSTVFLDFAPLTAIMIVAMSLLDDVPIMTIAYDNTPVSAKPIRWHMPQLLSVSAVLGVFSIVETFGLLLIGIRVLSHSHLQEYFGLASEDQLRTVMFLQLVAGGHLLLFITRSERWFFLPPFPALPLLSAIVLTQILAVLMCGFGWLVPSIPWTLIGWVWLYNIAWMFVLGGVRLLSERFAAYRTTRQAKSMHIVNQSLRLHASSEWEHPEWIIERSFWSSPELGCRKSMRPTPARTRPMRRPCPRSKPISNAWTSCSTCFTRTATSPFWSYCRRSTRPARTASFGTCSA